MNTNYTKIIIQEIPCQLYKVIKYIEGTNNEIYFIIHTQSDSFKRYHLDTNCYDIYTTYPLDKIKELAKASDMRYGNCNNDKKYLINIYPSVDPNLIMNIFPFKYRSTLGLPTELSLNFATECKRFTNSDNTDNTDWHIYFNPIFKLNHIEDLLSITEYDLSVANGQHNEDDMVHFKYLKRYLLHIKMYLSQEERNLVEMKNKFNFGDKCILNLGEIYNILEKYFNIDNPREKISKYLDEVINDLNNGKILDEPKFIWKAIIDKMESNNPIKYVTYEYIRSADYFMACQNAHKVACIRNKIYNMDVLDI